MTGTRTTAETARALIAAVRADGRDTLTELEGLELLSTIGVQVPQSRVVTEAAELDAAVAALRPPLVLKVQSPDLVHKSDVGGVRLGCRDLLEAREAFHDILESVAASAPGAAISGVVLAEQAQGVAECFVGAHSDPEFGPVVGFGLGGVFVEVVKDLAWRAAPFDAAEARWMIDETLASEVLAGWRGNEPGDVDALADALARMSELVWEARDQIAELDVNPILVGARGRGVLAVDSYFRLRGSPSGADDAELAADGPGHDGSSRGDRG